MIKNLLNYIIIIILSILSFFYILELYLNIDFKKKKIFKEYKKSTGKVYDKREKLDVFLQNRLTDPETVTEMNPALFLENNKIIPMGGISNSNTVFCNENGYYFIYDSDRFGFNNPDNEWDKEKIDYILLGDSFTQGACVNRPYDIASNIRKKKYNVLNLGYANNGPLIQLATLKEYLNPKIKNVIWLYYEGNDINDLEREKKSPILKKYLYENNFSQNLLLRQNEVDLLLRTKLNELVNIYIKRNEKNKKLKYKVLKFIRLDKAKNFFSRYNDLIKIDSGYQKENFDYKLFEKIIVNANSFANQNNSNFYVVYLPWFYRYKDNFEAYSYKKIKEIVENHNIKFIDINTEVFIKEDNPLNLFPFQRFGHYTPEGYYKVSREIINNTKN